MDRRKITLWIWKDCGIMIVLHWPKFYKAFCLFFLFVLNSNKFLCFSLRMYWFRNKYTSRRLWRKINKLLMASSTIVNDVRQFPELKANTINSPFITNKIKWCFYVAVPQTLQNTSTLPLLLLLNSIRCFMNKRWEDPADWNLKNYFL